MVNQRRCLIIGNSTKEVFVVNGNEVCGQDLAEAFAITDRDYRPRETVVQMEKLGPVDK